MEEIQFTENFNDLCVETGVNAGFQFEFYCESCRDTWRTEFVPYRSGQVSGWLGKAAGLLGGIASGVEGAAEGVAQSGFGSAKDQAFRAGAIAAAQAEGEARGKTLDVKRDRQLVCPSCGAQTHGAKFCPECGQKLFVV